MFEILYDCFHVFFNNKLFQFQHTIFIESKNNPLLILTQPPIKPIKNQHKQIPHGLKTKQILIFLLLIIMPQMYILINFPHKCETNLTNSMNRLYIVLIFIFY